MAKCVYLVFDVDHRKLMGSRVVFFPAIQNLDPSVGCCDLYVCTRGVLARFCQYVIAVFFRTSSREKMGIASLFAIFSGLWLRAVSYTHL